MNQSLSPAPEPCSPSWWTLTFPGPNDVRHAGRIPDYPPRHLPQGKIQSRSWDHLPKHPSSTGPQGRQRSQAKKPRNWLGKCRKAPHIFRGESLCFPAQMFPTTPIAGFFPLIREIRPLCWKGSSLQSSIGQLQKYGFKEMPSKIAIKDTQSIFLDNKNSRSSSVFFEWVL